jgi:hypothetical protein
MIRTNPANYFQCVIPSLEANEEEIWFQHPTEAIKCNQLGRLDFCEDDYSMVHLPPKSCYLRKRNDAGKFYLSIGIKSNVVWECYHQRSAPGRILHLNYNELDFTCSNLFSPEEETPYQKIIRNKEKSQWVKESARLLVKKEGAATAKGLDRETYRSLMRLPDWLITAANSLV